MGPTSAVGVDVRGIVNHNAAIVGKFLHQIVSTEMLSIIASKKNGAAAAFNENFCKFATVRLRNINIQDAETREGSLTYCYVISACAESLLVSQPIGTIGLKLVASIVNDTPWCQFAPLSFKPLVAEGIGNLFSRFHPSDRKPTCVFFV